METNINNALMLFGIGMITVFAILALVVITGTVLIKIVNSMAKEEVLISKIGGISPEIVASIAAVVDTVTDGKGIVSKIDRQ